MSESIIKLNENKTIQVKKLKRKPLESYSELLRQYNENKHKNYYFYLTFEQKEILDKTKIELGYYKSSEFYRDIVAKTFIFIEQQNREAIETDCVDLYEQLKAKELITANGISNELFENLINNEDFITFIQIIGLNQILTVNYTKGAKECSFHPNSKYYYLFEWVIDSLPGNSSVTFTSLVQYFLSCSKEKKKKIINFEIDNEYIYELKNK